jgi:RNA polymerase sigma factor (sigma-70 family)
MTEVFFLESGTHTLTDHSAAAAAAEEHRESLLAYIRRRVRDQSQAEDILQDVFFQLLTSYSVTEPLEHLSAWLYTVARNKIIDWTRLRRHREVSSDLALAEGPLNLQDILADPSGDPSTLLEGTLLSEELAEALEELPDAQREVFVMHELEGRSFKEIGRITGENVNTLLSRKRYALQYLRWRLEEIYRDLVR